MSAFNAAMATRSTAEAQHELKRLKALRRLQLLDTAPSPSFDRITRLAAMALNVPIVLVSLVDESRQWFKSHCGMEVTETPRDISFCTHAVRDEEPLIVPDATQDPRFSGNPLVVGDPQIRFYAGIPLFTQDGLAVGTLCAIDRRPRQLRYESLEALEDFACLAQDLINGRELLIRRRECVAYAAERDRLLQETVEAIPLGIVRASPAGKLREANVWTCDLLKCDLDTLLDHDIRDLIHPDDWTAHGVEIERVMAGTTGSHKAKLRVVRHDGSAVAVHVSFCLKRRGSGRPGYMLMLLDDRCADPLRRKSTD